MKYNADDLKQRFEAAYNAKNLWYANYLNAYNYVIPNRDAQNIWNEYTGEARNNTIRIYNQTPVRAARERCAQLQSLLFPAQFTWGKISPHFSQHENGPLLNMINWDKLNESIGNYIADSNLQSIASSMLLDLTVGSCGVWVDSPTDDRPLNFTTIPGLLIIPEHTDESLIRTVWFKREVLNRTLLASYPAYRGEQYKTLRENLNDVSYIYIGQIFDPVKNNYMLYGILRGDEDHPLFQYEKPYPQMIVGREFVRPGEVGSGS